MACPTCGHCATCGRTNVIVSPIELVVNVPPAKLETEAVVASIVQALRRGSAHLSYRTDDARWAVRFAGAG